MKITVNSVQQKISVKGTPYLLVVDDARTKYSVWDKALFGKFQQGAELDVNYEESGQYKTIKGVNSDGTSPGGASNLNKEICAQAMIKAAAELVGRIRQGSVVSVVDSAVDVAEIARSWVKVVDDIANSEPEPVEPGPAFQ